MYGKPMLGVSKEGDKYGFVNELQVRIEAGTALVFALYSFISIVFFGFFTIPSIVIGILWFDFLYKVFIKPESLFFGFFARTIARRTQKKEQLVGALQKKFSWKIGIVLSTFAFVCILIVSGFLAQYGIAVESYNISQTLPKLPWMAVPFTPPLVACIICIIFMFLESIVGYCVGCKIYASLIKRNIIKRVDGQNCANGVCEIPKK